MDKIVFTTCLVIFQLLIVILIIDNSVHCFASSEVIRQQEWIERDQERQRLEQKRQHEKALEKKPSRIEIDQSSPLEEAAKEDVCVQIDSIVLFGATLLSDSEKAGLSGPFIGRCLSMNHINEVVRTTTNLYIKRGYVTTRAFVPAQDLATRRLEIRVVEGEVESIRLNDDSPADRRRIAMTFPSGIVGKSLNLRDIEQGMDQLNRLPSGNAQLRLI
jgi:hemolysin activation/secretion protein